MKVQTDIPDEIWDAAVAAVGQYCRTSSGRISKTALVTECFWHVIRDAKCFNCCRQPEEDQMIPGDPPPIVFGETPQGLLCQPCSTISPEFNKLFKECE